MRRRTVLFARGGYERSAVGGINPQTPALPNPYRGDVRNRLAFGRREVMHGMTTAMSRSSSMIRNTVQANVGRAPLPKEMAEHIACILPVGKTPAASVYQHQVSGKYVVQLCGIAIV